MIKRVLIVLACLVFTGTVFAQDRSGDWEGSFTLLYQDSLSSGFDGGATLDIDAEAGWGFGLGYNLDSHWNFNFQFAYTSADYTATIPSEFPTVNPPREVSHTLSKYSTRFNAAYNFIDGPITPFVEGGIGWTRLDSNVIDGPPTTGCWWDPFWGYICSDYYNTYDSTRFTYNAGVGLRWDINRNMTLKGTYNREWMDLSSGGDLTFDNYSISIGSRF